MRKQVTLYDDQYNFYKTFHSEKLLISFIEYMFEDIEPEWLNTEEKVLFESLRIRMDNQKSKSNAGAKSHWWWRPRKNNEKTTEKQQKNNTKTTEKQQDKEEVEDKDIEKKEVEEKKPQPPQPQKIKYGECTRLSESEYNKLVTRYGEKMVHRYITQLDYYVTEKGKEYKSHYLTLLKRMTKDEVPEKKEIPKTEDYQIEDGVYDLEKLLNQSW